jgi:hypothetical protein
MFLPIFSSFYPTELEYFEAVRIPLTNTGPVTTQTSTIKFKPNLFQARGTVVRLLLKGIQAGNVSVTGCYIGKSAVSGNSANFASSPTQIFYNGSGSFVVPPEGLTTDVATFNTQDLVSYTISFNISASRMQRNTAVTGNHIPGYKSGDIVHYGKQGVAEAANVTKSGHEASPDICTMVGSIIVA